MGFTTVCGMFSNEGLEGSIFHCTNIFQMNKECVLLFI